MIYLFVVGEAGEMRDTDEEEERKCLLSESVTSSPVNTKTSKEDQGIRRHLLEERGKKGLLESLTPRLAWTSSSMADNNKEWRQ